MADMLRLRMTVRGRVQGVLFRQATANQANELGLTGWVKNLSDGGVEIVAEGPRRELEILAAWANEGPRMARVESVEEQWTEFQGGFDGFRVH